MTKLVSYPTTSQLIDIHEKRRAEELAASDHYEVEKAAEAAAWLPD